ncbi:MAG: hypothetical protein QOF33_1464 [Thermomicrobiales bacterium]|jgi:uncharacterized protein with HEPN domain|nr:hypothetical protein [Thermomicrobiales bacterium]
MRRRDDPLLRDVIAAANHIAAYLDEQTKQTFVDNSMRRDAVLMRRLVIGEVAARIPQPLRDRHPHVEWGAIVGFRIRAIHAYRSVDWDIVWNAATVNVPILVSQIASILVADFPAAEQRQRELPE